MAVSRYVAFWLLLGAFAPAAWAQLFPPTISEFNGPSGTVEPNATYFMTAYVTSAGPTPTGSLTFELLDASSAVVGTFCSSVPMDAFSQAQCSIPTPGTVGNWFVRVVYSGDPATAAGTQNFPFATQWYPAITQTGGPEGLVAVNSSFTMTVTVSSAGPLPTGTVDFQLYDSLFNPQGTYCGAVALVSGQAQCTFTVPPTPSNWYVVVTYSGDAATMTANQYYNFTTANASQVTDNTDSGSPGSLRYAINAVNAACVPTVITFNIPGAGPHVIRPLTELPQITCSSLSLNGYSQPGSAPNTDSNGGNNAVIKVVLDGSLCGADCTGLEIVAGFTTIRGLAIHSFTAHGIFTTGFVELFGNYIGTDPGGMTPLGNGGDGLASIGGARVGSGAPADMNLIVANNNAIVLGGGCASGYIDGNLIGGLRDGSAGNGNGLGIRLNANPCGANVYNNFIRYNLGVGIAVDGASSNLLHGGNRIFANGGIAVDLNDDGPTLNDELTPPYDADSGPNSLLNYPVITSVLHVGSDTVVSGYYKSETPCCGYYLEVELFHNSVASAVTEGEKPVALLSLNDTQLVGPGHWEFAHTIVGFLANNVSATAYYDSCGDGCDNSSEYSFSVAATTLATVPDAPTMGSATAGDTQATVTFTAPANDGGSPITSYTVTSSPGGITATGAASPITVTGLTNGTPYTFTVTATNAIGTGAASAPSNSVTPTTLPGAPNIGTAVAGNGQATVSFSPPASDGGSPITSYTATSSPGGITASGSGSPITVIGLTNGTTYIFTVRATNAVGTGPASVASNAVTPAAPPGTPGAPTIGTATAGDAQATVTFSPPASDGGSPITSYTVTSSPGVITASGSGSPITVSGLSNGTTYTFSVIATNAVGTGPASAPSNAVTPASPVPSLALTPASLTFAARTVATTSPAQTVTLTNNGPGTLSIGAITASGDFAFTSACPASIPSGGTCTVDVTFTPLTAGARAGSLMITTNASGSPHTVALSGTGLSTTAPVLELVNGIIEFPPQALGTESAVEIATVRNAGNAPLVFGPITTSGDFARRPIPAPAAASAAKVANAECGIDLAPNASCDIGVAFRPLAEGIRDGELAIASNATPRPASVRLIGTGVLGPTARALSTPDSVAFDARPVGTRSDGQAVTIRNNSASAVSITELEADGDFSISDTCTTIPARGTCTVLVSFRPSEEGERAGSLTISALGETLPYVISLRGVGVFNAIPALELSITRMGFGNALLGSAKAIGVDLVNVGQVPVLLGAITATGDFLLSHACGASLAVDASCHVQVTFFPRMVGGQAGILEVVSNAAGGPHQVELSGTGCAIPSIARSRVRPLLCSP